jgi:hypothetical protein
LRIYDHMNGMELKFGEREAAEKVYQHLKGKIKLLERRVLDKERELMVIEERLYRYERAEDEIKFDMDEYLGGGHETVEEWQEH